MQPALFLKVCLPLIGVAHTAMLAISTVEDEYNYYSELLAMNLFKAIQIGHQCAACTAAGIVCTCPIKNAPHWKPMANQKKIERIYGANVELMQRETRGVVASGRRYMYQVYLKTFLMRELHEFSYPCQYMLMAIDPSGGGTSSDYAVSMITSDNCRTPIVGLEASPSPKHNEIMKMLENFILRTRSMRVYRDALIFIAIEANMSFITADMLAGFFQNPRFGRIEVLSLDPKKHQRPGVWTGENEKERYAESMERALANGTLCYAREQAGDPAKWPLVKQEFQSQLGSFRREVDPAKDPMFGRNKITFTGKAGNGKKDDLVLATQIALYHLEWLKTTDRFQDMATAQGWRY